MLTPTNLPFVFAVAVTCLTSSVTCVLSLSRLPRKNGVADLDLLLRNSLIFFSSIITVSYYIITFKVRQIFSTISTLTFYYMNSYATALKQRKLRHSVLRLPTFCIMCLRNRNSRTYAPRRENTHCVVNSTTHVFFCIKE